MSYENEVKDKALKCDPIPDNVDLGLMKYLWQAGPFSFSQQENIPKFLTKVSVLKEFSDNELRLFSQYLHRRQFNRDDVVFRQGDAGYGFYFVLSGTVSIVHTTGAEGHTREHTLATLQSSQYFGEMGLLEEYNHRNASAVCNEGTVLLGLFKPDLESLLDQHPVVGAKFMREISLILAQRVGALMQEVTLLRHKLADQAIHP